MTTPSMVYPRHPSRLLDNSVGDLVLRVVDTGDQLRIRGNKCAIGSGPACQLRLQGEGIQPVHCVILRGPDVSAIRCWAAGTLLNGRPFTDQILGVGDEIRVGSTRMIVVRDDRTKAQVRSQSSSDYAHYGTQITTQNAFPSAQNQRKVQRLVHRLRRAEETITQMQVDAASNRSTTNALQSRIDQLEGKIAQSPAGTHVSDHSEIERLQQTIQRLQREL
ncbi:MAG: FHA domain-containing protein, partial [Planctomycetales bacterium]|nr:FHA domain-containing protein [Planctomycetales bacterium]